jgi:hypothetical protein
MKINVVVEAGKVVGVAPASHPSAAGTPGQFRGGLRAGPNQKLHEFEVAEDFLLTSNPEELHQRAATHLKK